MIFVSVFDQKLSDKRINTVHYDDADIRKCNKSLQKKMATLKASPLCAKAC